MNRPILICALFLCVVFAASTAPVGAQEASKSNPYQGVSNPSANDAIVTTGTPQPKPHAGKPGTKQPAEPVSAQTAAPTQTADQPAAQPQTEAQPTPTAPPAKGKADITDNGIVQVVPQTRAHSVEPPSLTDRSDRNDPDEDIVHPRPLGPNELEAGTTIRVKLLDRLSTYSTEQGQTFHSRVATDVLQGDRVLIPAGAEIDGTVVEVSSGHAGGHGSMHLRPEMVIMADGMSYRLYADVSGTPGAKAHVGTEGTILPDSRMKSDVAKYGGAVGVGVAAGGMVGGPMGAVTGGLVGAGVVTAHLLINHPQATLEVGAVLMFTLTDRLNLVPANGSRY